MYTVPMVTVMVHVHVTPLSCLIIQINVCVWVCVYNDKQYLTSVNLSADKFVLLIIRALLSLQVMQRSVMGFALRMYGRYQHQSKLNVDSTHALIPISSQDSAYSK